MKIALAIAAFLLFLPAQAATGGRGKSSMATPSPTRASTGHGGSTLRTMRDPRRAPEPDPGRKIHEQDCSKPIDLSAGNLLCK